MASQSKKPVSKKVWLVAIPVLIFAVIAAAWAITKSPATNKNYALQTSEPLESVLVKAGAVKKCGYGDDGKGTDNQAPWYDAFYELPANRSDTVELVKKAAKDNGYSLTHASKENRGGLGAIADEFIDNWYFDNTSKTSSYGDLEAGNVKLALGVNNDGEHSLSNISCGTKDTVVINSDENTSMISLSVKLPNFKK